MEVTTGWIWNSPKANSPSQEYCYTYYDNDKRINLGGTDTTETKTVRNDITPQSKQVKDYSISKADWDKLFSKCSWSPWAQQ